MNEGFRHLPQVDRLIDALGAGPPGAGGEPHALKAAAARRVIDELPAHVGGSRDPVDLDHVVLPLDPLRGVMLMLATVVPVSALVEPMPVFVSALWHQASWHELHAALRATIRCIARHLGVHRADVRRLRWSRDRKEFHAALRA